MSLSIHSKMSTARIIPNVHNLSNANLLTKLSLTVSFCFLNSVIQRIFQDFRVFFFLLMSLMSAYWFVLHQLPSGANSFTYDLYTQLSWKQATFSLEYSETEIKLLLSMNSSCTF